MSAMKTFVLSLPPETEARLLALAQKLNKPVVECLGMAVDEFIDGWETYLASVSLIDDEVRPVLRVVND